MGEAESAQFLSSRLAGDAHVSASTQNQALNGLLFLYKEILEKKVGFRGKRVGVAMGFSRQRAIMLTG